MNLLLFKKSAIRKFKKQSAVSYSITWSICLIAAMFFWYGHFLHAMRDVLDLPAHSTQGVSDYYIILLLAGVYCISAPIQLLSGVAVDRYRLRWVLFSTCLLAAISGALYFLTTGYTRIVLARMMDVATVFAIVGALKLASIRLPAGSFALYVGVLYSLGYIGELIVYDIHALGIATTNWLFQAELVAIIGGVLAILIVTFVRDKPVWLPNIKSNTPSIKQLVAYTGELFTYPVIWLLGVVGGILLVPNALFASSWWMAFLRQKFPHSHITTSMSLQMVVIGFAVGAPVIAWISRTIKRRKAPLLFCAIALSATMIVLMYVHSISFITLYWLHFALGFFSSAQVLVFAITYDLTTVRYIGVSVSVVHFLFFISLVSLQSLLILMQAHFNLSTSLLLGNQNFPAVDYHITLLAVLLMTLFGILLVCLIPETYGRPMNRNKLRAWLAGMKQT